MTEQELEIPDNQAEQSVAAKSGKSHSNPSIDTIMNINVTLSIQVGSTKMRLKDLMKLSKGTVVELNKMAGEPLDILVNDEPIARGEVVVVNGNYGIRITEVTKNQETLAAH